MGISITYPKTEQCHAFMKHVAADSQEPARPEAIDLGDQSPASNAAFSGTGLGAKPEEKRTVEVLYDSFVEPPAAGIRSLGMHVRQMLYRAEPYQIDLQLESQPDRNRLIVTGQLIDVSHPDLVHAGVQVTLSDAREDIVRALTNQFGEFRGEVNLSGDLELTFLGRNEKPIVILLRGALDPTSRAKN